jgi:hypothetical protein
MFVCCMFPRSDPVLMQSALYSRYRGGGDEPITARINLYMCLCTQEFDTSHLPDQVQDQVARLATSNQGARRITGPLTEGPGPTSRPGSLPAPRVACHYSPAGSDRQHILAHPVGPSSSTSSSSTPSSSTSSPSTSSASTSSTPSASSITDGGMARDDAITYEELSAEHKQRYDEIKAQFEADLIGSFERTRSHGVRWRGFSPKGALDGVDLSIPSEDRTRALRQEVNYAVAHSLHRHSESLVNAFERVALRVVQEIMKHQHSPTGPTLGSHKGELPFQTRPPLPYALAAAESHGAPAYVVYKMGGDPMDHQFFNEPPKEIPHGYMCAYIPDSSNPIHSAQKVAGGVSGADADKQAWLATYATGPSHDSMHSAPRLQTAEQISAILRDQFGILPKRKAIGYTKPYPSDYDLIPLPPKYRLPEFTKFSGAEGSSSIEHVSRYLAQLGMISVSDPLRVRFFSQSLTGPAFGWYTSLGPDSIRTWKQLEEQFHIQYHSEAAEARIADLAQV